MLIFTHALSSGGQAAGSRRLDQLTVGPKPMGGLAIRPNRIREPGGRRLAAGSGGGPASWGLERAARGRLPGFCFGVPDQATGGRIK